MNQKKFKITDPHKSREKFEVDVERMIDDGLAGGTVDPVEGRMQIEQARKLPKEHQPFPEKS